MSAPLSPAATSVVRDKAAAGLLALLVRQVSTVLVTLPAGIVLARILAPGDFGLYAIVSFVVMVLNRGLSLGFSSWLIQKAEEPTRGELNTIYTVQLVLYAGTFGALWFAAPRIVAIYGHNPVAVDLLRAMAVNILLIAFRAVPSALLERGLEYRKLAWIELVATLSFQAVAVGCALLSYGAWSLVLALLVSSATVTAQTNWHAPWRPGFGFDPGTVREALRFGSLWQLHQWVTLAKDNIVPTLIAAQFGPAAVGYLNLASGTIYRSLFIMPILQRVTFSMYARLQKDDQRLRTAVEHSMFVAAFVVVPPAVLIAALAEPILTLVYGSKWLPAVPALRWLCIPAVMATVNWTAVSAMFAVGRPGIPVRITTTWTVCLWILTLLLTSTWGFTGAAMASAATSGLVVWTVYELKALVPVRVLATIGRVFVVSGFVGAVAVAITLQATLTLPSLLGVLTLLLALGYALIGLLDPARVLVCLTELRRSSQISIGRRLDRVLEGLSGGEVIR